MSDIQLDRILEQMTAVAVRAGELLQSYFGKIALEQVMSKSSPVDLVSHADREAELLIQQELSPLVPDTSFLGEESVSSLPHIENGMCWVVDPLDGTSNFLAGLPVWSTSIALCRADLTPLAGVVHAPPLGRTWTAIRGAGARMNGVPIHVRKEPPGGGNENAMLATGFPYDVALGRADNLINLYAKMQARFQKIRRIGSAAIDLAFVAEGVYDGMWELRLREWDTAAGILLVQEAGGLCEQFDGSPYMPGAPEMLVGATPGLLALMRSVINNT